MKKRIFESIKLDADEKSDGQGFVLVGDPATKDERNIKAEEPKVEEAKPTPPVTEKITDSEDKFFSQFNKSEEPEHKEDGLSDAEDASKDDNRLNTKYPSKNILIVILALLLGLGGGFGGGMLAVNGLGNNSNSSGINIDATGEDLNVTEAVAKKVLPSVVGITATTTQVTEDMFFGQQEQEVSGVGSGLIVDSDGYILTNSHVVMDDDKSKLKVLLSDGREVDGTVEWFDAGLDLAIVKIKADNLTAVELGDSESLKVGQYVAAIGNPLGLEFQGSVTQGVVSGLDRSITASSETKETSMENLIQVDAAINSGNSGGPLLDSQGRVIGINTAKAEGGENMGFAIPIDTAKPIIESIKEDGEYSRAYMGISVANISEVRDQIGNTDLGTDTGAYVAQVTKGSPAEAAGLRLSDVIVEVSGTKVETSNDLISSLLKYRAGDTVTVKYYRGKKLETTDVKLTNEVQAGNVPE
jgi:S1-C subfamily serine protease